MITLSLTSWILAFLPVLIILFLMTIMKMGGSRAGVYTYIATILISFAFFGLTGKILVFSGIKSLILSLDVLLIIWGALFLYQVTRSAGTIQLIGEFFQHLSDKRSTIGIFLGWLFPSFLQGMGGFGVPVAVSAPLLVSAGFSPELAVIITSIGHGWGVTFGSMASSIRTTLAVTGVPVHTFGPPAAILLGITAVFSGIVVTMLAAGKNKWIPSLPLTLLCGSILAFGQYLFASGDFWIIAVTMPALIALAAAFLYTILTSSQSRIYLKGMEKPARKQLLDAMFPYLVLVTMIFVVNFSIPLREMFSVFDISFQFPELITNFNIISPAEMSRSINPFIHPGIIILMSGLISFVYLRKGGYIEEKSLSSIISETLKRSAKTSIAIFALVGSAVIMNYAGMTELLAKGISHVVSVDLYPFVSPFIGALGAFITGSNNNSNVLFASLQMQSAQMIGLPVGLILAAQTAGGALGSIIAPAKIILGCSTVGLAGKEGQVISKLLLYGVFFICLIGIATICLLNWNLY